jgi:SpoVK/Ycf46/Vps4 family AAA+-type ATPase
MNNAHISVVTTNLTWNDLQLNNTALTKVTEIKNYLKESSFLKKENNLKKNLKTGYRVLFIGPPGAGKTLTASLIGKELDKPVYKIDLSQVVSKYIGETEKNLEIIFANAEGKNWILFFDEADALFGKRTTVKDAHDRFANQEVSYLLQRIEEYNGIAILTSNLKGNIDESFTRRFQSVVHFPPQSTKERIKK